MNEPNDINTQYFADGVMYALEYFRDEVYGDGVAETDLWKDYFGCDECSLDSEECNCNA